MGIGNLNNSFGRLTAGKAINKAVNAKNTAKAENTENTSAQVKSNSLNSSTLNEQQGKIFDSNNFGQETSAKTASKGKGKGKKTLEDHYNDFCNKWKEHHQADNIQGLNYDKNGNPIYPTNQGGPNCNSGSQAQYLGFMGIIYATYKTLTGGRMVSQEQLERSLEQSRGYTTNEFNNKKEHITTD